MRGGARPFIYWAAILACAGAANALWTGDGIQMAEFGTAILLTLLVPAGLILRSRDSLRNGEPKRRPGLERIPGASVGAPLLALGFASLFYGFTFGHLFVYFGLGIIATALGKLAVELYSQLRSSRDPDQHPPPRSEE